MDAPTLLDFSAMKSILVLQMKRIGDFILTTPALRALRAAFPQTHLTLVVDEDTAAAASLIRGIDLTLVYRKNSLNPSLFRALLRGGFDLALDYTETDRSAFLTRLSRARHRLTFSPTVGRPARAWATTQRIDSPVLARHTVDRQLDLLSPLGIQVPQPDLHLDLNDDAFLSLEKIVPHQNYFVFHPGAARAEKYWPAHRWAEVIAHAQSVLGYPVILIGGNSPLERTAIADIQRLLPHPAMDLSGRFTLEQSAALISRAALFLGIDSGPSHLAAALQTPQITLFGPTNPFHWRARHPRALTLQGGKTNPLTDFSPQSPGGDLNALSTADVIHAINLLVKTSNTHASGL